MRGPDMGNSRRPDVSGQGFVVSLRYLSLSCQPARNKKEGATAARTSLAWINSPRSTRKCAGTLPPSTATFTNELTCRSASETVPGVPCWRFGLLEGIRSPLQLVHRQPIVASGVDRVARLAGSDGVDVKADVLLLDDL